jgi:hypothetical protein
MLSALPFGDIPTIATLLCISLLAFVLGEFFRKWPEKIESITESINGYAWFISPAANRIMIVQSGVILIGLSFATLLLAMWML